MAEMEQLSFPRPITLFPQAAERSGTPPPADGTPATPTAAVTPTAGDCATPTAAVTPRSKSGSRPRSARATRHTIEVPEQATRLQGMVVSQVAKFGFIKCAATETRYFFHVNDSDGRTSTGCTVSFVVAKDLTTSKDVAYDVQMVAPPTPRGGGHTPRSAGGLTPRSARGGGTPDLPFGLPLQQQAAAAAAAAAAALGGTPRASPAPPASPLAAAVAAADAALSASPAKQEGYALMDQRALAFSTAPGGSNTAVQAPAQPSGPRAQRGVAGGGGGGEELLPGPFRGTVVQAARGPPQVQVDDGLLLYTDTAGLEQQAMYGNWRLADGMPRLEAGDAVEFEVLLNGATRVRKAVGVRLLAKGMTPTPSLERAMAAADADPTRGRQLGRVTLLKKEFGFIRQMERPGDMFFHFSNLDGIRADEVKVGDDVEYSVKRDREGKLSAVQVRRAPPGSVVFDIVSETVHRGVVLEKPIPSKQYVQSSGVLEYMAGGEGGPRIKLSFAAAEVVGGGAIKPGDHVTFRVATNLQAARAAQNASVPAAALFAGKRAVEVAVVRPAGTVATVNRERQFGFINYEDPGTTPTTPPPVGAAASAAPVASAAGDDAADAAASSDAPGRSGSGGEAAPAAGGEGEAAAPAAKAPQGPARGGRGIPPGQSRIFFHFNEVAGNILLKPGDEVLFVLHTNLKSGEINACRVKRTKEGPELPPPPVPAAAPPPRLPAVNPNKIKLTGNLERNSANAKPRITKGPDGTPGFDLPRTAPAELPPVPGFSMEKRGKAAEAGVAETAAAAGATAPAADRGAENTAPAPQAAGAGAGPSGRSGGAPAGRGGGKQGGQGGRGGRSQSAQQPFSFGAPAGPVAEAPPPAPAAAAAAVPAPAAAMPRVPSFQRFLSADAPAFIPRTFSSTSVASIDRFVSAADASGVEAA